MALKTHPKHTEVRSLLVVRVRILRFLVALIPATHVAMLFAAIAGLAVIKKQAGTATTIRFNLR